MRSEISRGDIWWVEWSPGRGSEQAGRRPALVVQTDTVNRSVRYNNVIVLAMTTQEHGVPTHVRIDPSPGNGLRAASFIMCEQVMTISKQRLEGRLGRASAADMQRTEVGLRRILGR